MDYLNNNSGNEISEYRGMLQRLIELGIGTSEKVDQLSGKVGQMEKRMDGFEFNEEITYTQQQALNTLICKIVRLRLGINPKKSEWSDEERLISEKYGKLFSKRLRQEVSNKGHLAYPFRATRKGNYQAALEDIEAWVPRNGIESLKKEADDNAMARRIAREQGYM